MPKRKEKQPNALEQMKRRSRCCTTVCTLWRVHNPVVRSRQSLWLWPGGGASRGCWGEGARGGLACSEHPNTPQRKRRWRRVKDGHCRKSPQPPEALLSLSFALPPPPNLSRLHEISVALALRFIPLSLFNALSLLLILLRTAMSHRA